jgi:hypothetical protein
MGMVLALIASRKAASAEAMRKINEVLADFDDWRHP